MFFGVTTGSAALQLSAFSLLHVHAPQTSALHVQLHQTLHAGTRLLQSLLPNYAVVLGTLQPMTYLHAQHSAFLHLSLYNFYLLQCLPCSWL